MSTRWGVQIRVFQIRSSRKRGKRTTCFFLFTDGGVRKRYLFSSLIEALYKDPLMQKGPCVRANHSLVKINVIMIQHE